MRAKILKIVSAIIIGSISLNASATVKGEKTVGLRAGYSTRNENPVAGVFFQYSFSRHFRLAPNADYIFRNNGIDGLSFNLNAHFPIGLSSSRFDIYPLVGLGFVAMSAHSGMSTDDVSDDVTTRSSKFGLNIGGGVEFMATQSLKLFAEGKFNWIDDFNSGVFCIGIGYVF